MRKEMFSDSWRPWIAFPCADGRWEHVLVPAINTYNGGPTNQSCRLGGPHVIADFLREKENLGEVLQSYINEVKFAQRHHGIKGIQLCTHLLCAATQEKVCEELPEASKVYKQPTKVDLDLFYNTLAVETRIHRQDLELVKNWIFETFPTIEAVQFLRSVKFWLRPFGQYEEAIKIAASTLQKEFQEV